MQRISTARRFISLVILSVMIVGCGGGGSGGGTSSQPPVNNLAFSLDKNFVQQGSENYVSFVKDKLTPRIRLFNKISNVFNGVEIPVTYGKCGQANAFYSPSRRAVTLCDELTLDAFTYFAKLFDDGTSASSRLALDSAFDMVTFALYHEVGHALDDLGNLGVGGNFESVADAIGVVLSVKTQQPFVAIRGAQYFLGKGGGGSFADEHGSGIDRGGDILCWTLGSSSRLAAAFPEATAALAKAGRDCVGEYANQKEFVSQLAPALNNLPPIDSVRSRDGFVSSYMEVLDKELAKLLQKTQSDD